MQLPPRIDFNPKEPTFEDISDSTPSNNQPSTSFPPKENVEESLEFNFKVDSAHNNTLDREKSIENTTEKENLSARNAKIQIEKTFNLETEIGKLKIAIPLSELAEHDIYRERMSRSLQIS